MLFRSCLPSISDMFGSGYTRAQNCDDNGIRSDSDGDNIRSVLKMDPSTGVLRIPSYTQISRADHCALLKNTWRGDWEKVVELCASQPWRTLHMTKYSGRTALHLATFDRRCPLRVARALLKANRQMIAVRDSNNYTPLHIVAFFSAATSNTVARSPTTHIDQLGRTTGEAVTIKRMGRTTEGDARAEKSPLAAEVRVITLNDECNEASKQAEGELSEAEARSVMTLFCDTAIMVEQELGRALGKHREEQQLPLPEGTSPLYLAAKKAAPVSILKILLKTRSSTSWIAPSTGGEPYWYGNNSSNDNCKHIDLCARGMEAQSVSFSSPLEIMLREDRLRSSMNTSYYRNDAYLLGEEEDGNLLRRGRNRSSINHNSRSTPTVQTKGISPHARRSALHPDEILGFPHLIREMRRMTIDRCREHYCHGNCEEKCGEENQKTGDVRQARSDDDSTHVNDGSTSISTLAHFTQSQQRCLELWEKCVELLVTAGGGGIPLLLLDEENPKSDEKATDPPTTKYTDSLDVPYGILHACVCCKVPVAALVEVALILFPEQVFKRDAIYGLVPLHHVLRAEYKYSYATTNLLTILLKGRASARKSKKRQEQLSTNAASAVASSMREMPELSSLLNIATRGKGYDKNTASQSHSSTDLHLRSSVLLPFPFVTNNSSSSTKRPNERNKGPIPLVFAIRLGLPMDGVINKLLEADSHKSLRTRDPTSQLPPFALVATRVCLSEQEQCNLSSNHDKSSDLNRNQHDALAATTYTAVRSRRDHSNDITTTVIDSTINSLSSGDGSCDFAITSASTMLSSSMSSSCSKSKCHEENNFGSAYKLDDVYRLLLAHPQVLAQYGF